MNEFIGSMKIEMLKRDGDMPDLPIIYLSEPFKGWMPGDVFLPTNKFLDVEIRWKEEKPPIGIMSRGLWLEQRYVDLLKAIDRYKKAGAYIPVEWKVELESIRGELAPEFYTREG